MNIQVNKEFLKESILQACEDIKSSVDDIIANIDAMGNLDITISVTDDTFPEINISGDYTKYVTVTDKILEAAMNGQIES